MNGQHPESVTYIWDLEFAPTRLHLARALRQIGARKHQVRQATDPKQGRFFVLLVHRMLLGTEHQNVATQAQTPAEVVQVLKTINDAVLERGEPLPAIQSGYAPALSEAIKQFIADYAAGAGVP